MTAARARPGPDPSRILRHRYEEPTTAAEPEALGGMPRAEREGLGGTDVPADAGDTVRFAEAVRRTMARELEVNLRLVVFGEDVGRKGGVHLVTEGLQKRFGERRVFDTSLSEEGIVGRAVGMAVAGLVPAASRQRWTLAPHVTSVSRSPSRRRLARPIGST